MNMETLIKRRDRFIEALRQLNYPYVIAYAHTFTLDDEPLQAHCCGAGRKCSDIDSLLNALGGAAHRNLGVGQPCMSSFHLDGTVRGVPAEPEPESPGVVLEEPCSS